MKKLIAVLFLLFFSLPVTAKEYKNNHTSNIIWDLFPENQKSEYIKTIQQNELSEYKKDMKKGLKHILYDKIASMPNSTNKRTLKQLLIYIDKQGTHIYKDFLSGKLCNEGNNNYVNFLDELLGIVSLYPEAITEEMLPVIKKYNLPNIGTSTNSDICLYKYYIEDYDIKYANEFRDLIILKEKTYEKLYNYRNKISPF